MERCYFTMHLLLKALTIKLGSDRIKDGLVWAKIDVISHMKCRLGHYFESNSPNIFRWDKHCWEMCWFCFIFNFQTNSFNRKGCDYFIITLRLKWSIIRIYYSLLPEILYLAFYNEKEHHLNSESKKYYAYFTNPFPYLFDCTRGIRQKPLYLRTKNNEKINKASKTD